jgi:outer membrane beta-barrel protein
MLKLHRFHIQLIVFTAACASLPAFAADGSSKSSKSAPSASASPSPEDQNADTTGAERVNVENIKEKYWARGDESELGVVQNRLYSKSHRIELGVTGGFNSTDALLSVREVGFTLGYHVNEYISFHLMYMRYFTSSSLDSAGTQVLAQQDSPALNSNKPQDYFGGEVRWSLLYGKLSLLGKAIIYYDLHLDGGLGDTLYNAPTPANATLGIASNSNSGSSFSESVGIGQQFYLNHHFTFNVDYRMIHYEETLLQTVIPQDYGQAIGSRANFSHVISLGFSYFIDIFK